MSRTRHLTDRALVALARRDRTLTAKGVSHHLLFCASCREDVSDLRNLNEYLRQPLPEPPRRVLERAWSLVLPKPPQRAERERFRSAVLVYDSTAGFAAASGVRSPVGARRQLWRTAQADIDLRLEPPGLGSTGGLTGQVLSRRSLREAAASGTAWLVERGSAPHSAPVSRRGEFTLPPPRGRRWTLWVEWRGLHVRVIAR